jgi:hypothetical protein
VQSLDEFGGVKWKPNYARHCQLHVKSLWFYFESGRHPLKAFKFGIQERRKQKGVVYDIT